MIRVSAVVGVSLAALVIGCAQRQPVVVHGHKIIEVTDPEADTSNAFYVVRSQLMGWDQPPDARGLAGNVLEHSESWEGSTGRSISQFTDRAGIRYTLETIKLQDRPMLLVLDATDASGRPGSAESALMEFNNRLREELSRGSR